MKRILGEFSKMVKQDNIIKFLKYLMKGYQHNWWYIHDNIYVTNCITVNNCYSAVIINFTLLL